jgi:DNA mismatch repair ATPase MutS
MIITGVNASGKTTVIKTVTINIIFSQQFGCGYYRSGQLLPYRHIYSYLNIPDTANRDSLFQAESRRCKSILDSIDASVDDRHFCIFDELYSGTNPDEATKAACSYVSYLSKYKFVTFLLTTHYYEICHYVEKKKEGRRNKIKNYHMGVAHGDGDGDGDEDEDEDALTNSYALVEGISMAKNGAYRVLAEMQYPIELLQSMIQP